MLKVAIVDKRDVMTQGLSRILESNPKINPVGICAPDITGALKMVLEQQPEIIFLDIGYNGIDIYCRIHQERPQIRFVAVTDHLKFSECCFVFENGAGAYLSKEDITVGNISEIIVLVADGKFIVSPLIIKQMFSGTRSVLDHLFTKRLGQKLLSQREISILAMAAQGLSNSEIAAGLEISVHTVRVHMSNIMEKLGAKNRMHAVYLGLMSEYSTLTAPPSAPDNPSNG